MLERFAVEATLVRRAQNGVDSYNNPVYIDCDPETVSVLACPQAFDEYESELRISRPEGVRTSMTFYFGKAVKGSLKGAVIRFGGKDYRVIGDPQPYPICPTDWNRIVQAEVVDG